MDPCFAYLDLDKFSPRKLAFGIVLGSSTISLNGIKAHSFPDLVSPDISFIYIIF